MDGEKNCILVINKSRTSVMADNTRSLIITGIFTVTFPVAIALLGPVAAAAVWMFTGGNFLLWPLFAGMIAGIILSYFVYRFTSPRWLSWALQRSTNPPQFKRKAIRNGLINEKGRALLGSEHFLDADTQHKLNEIDHRIALHDNSDVPAERTLYRKGDNAQLILRINDKGLSLPEGEWGWSQIDTVRLTERRSSSGSPGRVGYHTTSHRVLSFETITGKRHAISLDQVRMDFDLEEEISVYRYRHQQKEKRGEHS
jgi:hypothetical protein